MRSHRSGISIIPKSSFRVVRGVHYLRISGYLCRSNTSEIHHFRHIYQGSVNPWNWENLHLSVIPEVGVTKGMNHEEWSRQEESLGHYLINITFQSPKSTLGW